MIRFLCQQVMVICKLDVENEYFQYNIIDAPLNRSVFLGKYFLYLDSGVHNYMFISDAA